jgi:hypothetical protein
MSFVEMQALLTEMEIAHAARAVGSSQESMRSKWDMQGLKAIYAVEEEWYDTWTVVDLVGGIQYQPRIGGNPLRISPTYNRLRLFYVKGSLVGEAGLSSDIHEEKPWGTLINHGSEAVTEITLKIPIRHLEAAQRTLETHVPLSLVPQTTEGHQPEELCHSCIPTLCNVVLEITNGITGMAARLRVGNPALKQLDEIHAWSASRVAAGADVQGVWSYIESGWDKWLCFTSVGCPYYGSWKGLHRHIVVRNNPSAGYELWDMANTRVGLNQLYRVESEWVGDPWNVIAWSAWVEQTKFLTTWTGFADGQTNWYGAETENLDPLSGMDTTVSVAQYRASNGNWWMIGGNWHPTEHQAVPPYSAQYFDNGVTFGGCN